MRDKVKPVWQFLLAMIPFILFVWLYDGLRMYPNYLYHAIDTRGLYEAEKSLFGITVDGKLMTLCEYFAGHHHPVLDILAGLFYLCWVPVPFFFGVYLYLNGERELYYRFAWTFLFVNLIGFVGYYIHPAAPPWYIIQYGFDPVISTPGNVGGFARFDAITGIPVFQFMYSQTSNVFAALPSLHAAYMVVAVGFALQCRRRWRLVCYFVPIMVGIWWAAVYSTHHYVIDVLLGISCAVFGVGVSWMANRLRRKE